ncbi:MAG: hypothetical protein JWR55_619 [Aeromicrobium sp.]|nr:hypothetical protein [Aeromicrobium sp.]
MKKLARNTLALGTATLIVTAGLSFAATGADATASYSTGRFLTGSIGGTNLDQLAQLRGVKAANPGNPGANKNPLDLTVLSALPVNVPGGLNLNLANFLSPSGSAGAINQFASAASPNKAIGASGLVNDSGAVLAPNSATPPTNARVTLLDGPLAGATGNLADVDLLVGALSSSTTVTGGTPSRDYQIAGLRLELDVPVLGDLVEDITTAGGPLAAANVDDITLSPAVLCSISSTALNVPAATILNLIPDPTARATIDALLNPVGLPAISTVNLCDTSVPLVSTVLGALSSDAVAGLISVNVTGVGGLLDALKDASGDGIAVDLTGADAGKVTIDLEKILAAAGANLNDLPPNSDILAFVTNNLVGGKISSLVRSVTDNLVTAVGDVDATVTVAGTELPLTLDQLTDPVSTNLVTLLDGLSDALDAVGTGMDPALNQLVPNLKQLVQLTGNNQSTSTKPTLDTGTVNAGSVVAAAVGDYYRTSALKLNVLNSALNLDLAASEGAVVAVQDVDGPAADDDDSDTPTNNDSDNDGDSDAQSDADAGGAAAAGDDSDTVADADAQADADVTTTLPSTGAPNLLPFWLLGIALLLFGGAVLVNEKRRLSAS